MLFRSLEAAPYGQYSDKVAKLVVTFRNVEPLKAMLLDAIVAYES